MAIDPETVAQLAQLARLDLSADEAERMRGDLEAILGYVAKLEELDTDDVDPTTHVLGLLSPLREDAVAGVLPADEAVRNAPERSDSAMVVPQVIE